VQQLWNGSSVSSDESVFGKFFYVDAVEALEPEAAALGGVTPDTFIFDGHWSGLPRHLSQRIAKLDDTIVAVFPYGGKNENEEEWSFGK
jgi:hypothetical protein